MADKNLMYDLPEAVQGLVWRKYFMAHVMEELKSNEVQYHIDTTILRINDEECYCDYDDYFRLDRDDFSNREDYLAYRTNRKEMLRQDLKRLVPKIYFTNYESDDPWTKCCVTK